MHRFIGSDFPHIDPVKEVEAARRKLGPAFDHMPLSTIQNETENLMAGDSDQNMEQAQRDLTKAKGLGLIDESTTEG
jgi:capsid protein